MICGDLNAHTGNASDIADACDWDSMQATNLGVPPTYGCTTPYHDA